TSAGRVFRRAVREAEIEQERAERRARTALGGSVADLHTLIASGYRAGLVAQLAAQDCALFLWCNWPNMPIWREVIAAWDFTFSGLGFDWIKLNANGEGLHWGNGYARAPTLSRACLRSAASRCGSTKACTR